MEYVKWHSQARTFNWSGNNWIVPWRLLEHVKEVKILDLCHRRFEDWLPGAAIETLTTTDIVQIQTLCPDLEEFHLDVGHAPRGGLQFVHIDVLEALSQFQQPIKLRIQIHDHTSPLDRFFMDRWDFRVLVNAILEHRKHKQLPSKAPFDVGFKLIREWDKIKTHWDIPDYRFWVDDAGEVCVEKRLFNRRVA